MAADEARRRFCLADPAAALVPAGLGLLLQVLPLSHRIAGRVVHGIACLLALAAAGGLLASDDGDDDGDDRR